MVMTNNKRNIKFKDSVIIIAAYGTGWIAVDKPFGVSIHNDPGRDLSSLLKFYLSQEADFSEEIQYDKTFGVNPVNRIDLETSGIVLFGLQKKITAFFSGQFQERNVRKKYLALVHGHPQTQEESWDMPLTAKAGGRKNPAGAGKKVNCLTRYRVLETSDHYSLLECEPYTGRKHQIRRHAKLNGTPITGDTKYGSPRSIRFLEENCNFKRLGLHSLSLAITTPDGEKRIIESELPNEFTRLIESDK